MNKEQFNQLLEHPQNLSQQDAQVLNELITQFPYFQTAHLLYLKGLHNENSIHFDKQLKVAAAYSGDRKVLYQLIHEPKTAFKDVVAPVVSSEALAKEVEEIKPSSASPSKNFGEGTKASEDNEDKDTHSESLDKMMREQAISTSIIYDIEQLEEDSSAEATEPETEVPAPEEVEAPIDYDTPRSFSDWIKTSGGSTGQKAKNFELIDQFIQKEPKIEKPDTKFFSPVDMAKKSVSDADNALITETLAKIYFDQGNLPKALQAYEALLLKHPEKKAIFAARIKTIKKLINTK